MTGSRKDKDHNTTWLLLDITLSDHCRTLVSVFDHEITDGTTYKRKVHHKRMEDARYLRRNMITSSDTKKPRGYGHMRHETVSESKWNKICGNHSCATVRGIRVRRCASCGHHEWCPGRAGISALLSEFDMSRTASRDLVPALQTKRA